MSHLQWTTQWLITHTVINSRWFPSSGDSKSPWLNFDQSKMLRFPKFQQSHLTECFQLWPLGNQLEFWRYPHSTLRCCHEICTKQIQNVNVFLCYKMKLIYSFQIFGNEGSPLDAFEQISSDIFILLEWGGVNCTTTCSLIHLTTTSNTNLRNRNSRRGSRDVDVDNDTLMRHISGTLLASSLTQLPWTVGSFIWLKGTLK